MNSSITYQGFNGGITLTSTKELEDILRMPSIRDIVLTLDDTILSSSNMELTLEDILIGRIIDCTEAWDPDSGVDCSCSL